MLSFDDVISAFQTQRELLRFTGQYFRGFVRCSSEEVLDSGFVGNWRESSEMFSGYLSCLQQFQSSGNLGDHLCDVLSGPRLAVRGSGISSDSGCGVSVLGHRGHQ